MVSSLFVLLLAGLTCAEPIRKKRQGLMPPGGGAPPNPGMNPMSMYGMGMGMGMGFGLDLGEGDGFGRPCGLRRNAMQRMHLAHQEGPDLQGGMNPFLIGGMVGCTCMYFDQCESTMLPLPPAQSECNRGMMPPGVTGAPPMMMSPFVCCCGSKKK